MTYLDDGGVVALRRAHGDDVALFVHEDALGLHVAALHVEAVGSVHDGDLLYQHKDGRKGSVTQVGKIGSVSRQSHATFFKKGRYACCEVAR